MGGAPLDLLFLAALVLVCLWEAWSVTVDRRGRRWRAAGLVVLALAQWLVHGFTWQFVPAYALVLAACASIWTRDLPPARSRFWYRLGWAGGLVVLVPWALFPAVPTLPAPQGPYSVGTQVLRWVDESRSEEATDAEDRRNVIVQVWYPAEPGPGAKAPYLDRGPSDSPAGFLPAFLLARYGEVETHARVGRKLSTAQTSWPVALFLTGYGGIRGAYTSMVSDLASRGVVVFALDHPYEAAVVELADGTVARTVERFEPGDLDRTRFMEGRLGLRVADVRFVLDQLERPGVLDPEWDGRLDQGVAIWGHSLGGASSAAAMAADPRLVAAVNVDGTLYGPIPGVPTPRPFLVIESDRTITGHSETYRRGNRDLGAFFSSNQVVELEGTSHYSFTDLEFLLGPLSRMAWWAAVGSRRDPAEVQRATVQLVYDWFWNEAWKR